MNNEDFVKAYLEAHDEGRTQTSVAEALGITPSAVSAKKKKLTEAGVKLPVLKRASNDVVDVTGLQDLIDSHVA